MNAVVLKKGKETIFLRRHHWIFSGAIASYPKNYQNGDVVAIHSASHQHLGLGYFNQKCSLAGRILVFGEDSLESYLKKKIQEAVALREVLFKERHTTAQRLINGEGDGLPGLIVDRYGPYLVMQAGTLGMRKLLPFFAEEFKTLLPIAGIYEKSTAGSLKEEGLSEQEGVVWGEVADEIEVLEEGMRLYVPLKSGQKTGFFIDQREMRQKIRSLSHGKRVLNGFCYTGGFSLAALYGGALHVDSVDVSASALKICDENILLNGFVQKSHLSHKQDMFAFLEASCLDYDIVILDPPAFAKKKKDVPAAICGYKRLFELAIAKMKPGSLLLLASCSYYITEELFKQLVLDVSLKVNRPIRVIGGHIQAEDHPINLFHPESGYLKSLLLAL